MDVGDDQVDHGQAEHGAGEGHAVHQGVGYLNVNILMILVTKMKHDAGL